MENLVIDDSLKKGKEELLLDPGKETVRCGKKVTALVFNDLMYKQEDGSFIKASDLLKQKVLSVSNISISMVQTEATITWAGAEAVTITVDDEAPKAPSGSRLHKQVYTVGHHKVGIKADADSVTAYIGLEIRDDGLKTPEQVAQIVANATNNLKTQAELDQAVATATAGLKTPEQVQAEIDAGVETALETSQGYIDTLKVDTVAKLIHFMVDESLTPKATGVNYVKVDGTKSYSAIPNDRTMVFPYEDYRFIEVRAGNNKIIDKVDFHFLTVVPAPAPVIAINQYVTSSKTYKAVGGIETTLLFLQADGDTLPNKYQYSRKDDGLGDIKDVKGSFIAINHSSDLEYVKLYKDEQLLQIYKINQYDETVYSQVITATKVKFTSVQEQSLPAKAADDSMTKWFDFTVDFFGSYTMLTKDHAHETGHEKSTPGGYQCEYSLTEGVNELYKETATVTEASHSIYTHGVYLEPNKTYRITTKYNNYYSTLDEIKISLQSM